MCDDERTYERNKICVFVWMTQRLREAGKHVVGFGEKKTPVSFVTACEHFIFIENMLEKKVDGQFFLLIFQPILRVHTHVHSYTHSYTMLHTHAHACKRKQHERTQARAHPHPHAYKYMLLLCVQHKTNNIIQYLIRTHNLDTSMIRSENQNDPKVKKPKQIEESIDQVIWNVVRDAANDEGWYFVENNVSHVHTLCL